jgi:hypothetical protein
LFFSVSGFFPRPESAYPGLRITCLSHEYLIHVVADVVVYGPGDHLDSSTLLFFYETTSGPAGRPVQDVLRCTRSTASRDRRTFSFIAEESMTLFFDHGES